MKSAHTYIHTYILLLAVAWLPLFSKKIPTDYNGNIFKKNNVILTPASVYNGQLTATSMPQLAGYLDQYFNGTGYEVLPYFTGSSSDKINSIALQSDGKILIGGQSSVGGRFRYSIARLKTNGSLDTTFNPTGDTPGAYILPQLPGSTDDIATALQVQPDGKIVLAGYSFVTVGSQYHFSIIRLTTDGSLDTTFNPTGALPGTLVLPTFTGSLLDRANALTLQPDGKILIAGISFKPTNRYSIARITTTGSLDTTFNPTGSGGTQAGTFVLPTFTGSTTSEANALALQPDGKIVLSGYTTIGTNRYSVARLTAIGSLDATFNSTRSGGTQAGTFVLPTFTGSTTSQANALALQPDGKIVLGGYTNLAATNRYSVARITTDGSLDTTFNPRGSGGTQAGTFIFPTFNGINDNKAFAIQLQSDGKIILAGSSNSGIQRYSIARITTDGSLDTTFGLNQTGFSVLQNFDGNSENQANCLAIQQNNTIILAGYSENGRIRKYSLAQLTNNPKTLTQYQAQYPGQGGFY